MTNLDRDITLPTKVRILKAMVFPVVMYGCESWTIKKHWRIDPFKLWCWRRLLRVPWTARRSNQSILKEVNPEYSLEALKLKLILWTPDAKSQLIGKDPHAGKDWRQDENKTTENEMVGRHHRLNGHEFEQTQGEGEGQGSLACCSPWGHRESDTTQRLNSNNHLLVSFSLFQVVNKVSSPSFMFPVPFWSLFPSHHFLFGPLQ